MLYKNIIEAIGHTPVISLKKIDEELYTNLHAKLESFNPLSSVKDRTSYAMIADAEKKKTLDRNTVIVEATSGNTGIALAYISRVKGYRLILTMPETMSIERVSLLEALGAEVILTPATEGMYGALLKAETLAKQFNKSFIPAQFENPANPLFHYQTTGPEIWEQTGGKVDYFVAGVGTGGTLTGAGKYLKEKNPRLKIIAVEPAESPILSGGKPGSHGIQGIGAGFIPPVLDRSLIDKVVTVTEMEAVEHTRILASREGILCGYSSGAALSGAIKLSRNKKYKDKNIVLILPDGGERYLSTNLFRN